MFHSKMYSPNNRFFSFFIKSKNIFLFSDENHSIIWHDPLPVAEIQSSPFSSRDSKFEQITVYFLLSFLHEFNINILINAIMLLHSKIYYMNLFVLIVIILYLPAYSSFFYNIWPQYRSNLAQHYQSLIISKTHLLNYHDYTNYYPSPP